MISPCMTCSKRAVWCHSDCQEYAAFRREADARRKKEEARRAYNDMKCESIARIVHKNHRKNKFKVYTKEL